MDWKDFFMPRGRKILLALIILFLFYWTLKPGEDYLLAIFYFIIFYLVSCAIVYSFRLVKV